MEGCTVWRGVMCVECTSGGGGLCEGVLCGECTVGRVYCVEGCTVGRWCTV